MGCGIARFLVSYLPLHSKSQKPCMPSKKVNCYCSGCNGRLREVKTARAHAEKEAAAEQSAIEQAERYRNHAGTSHIDEHEDSDMHASDELSDAPPEEEPDMDTSSPAPLHTKTAGRSHLNRSPVIFSSLILL